MQLTYNKDFTDIIGDIQECFNTFADIPIDIQNFINKTIDKIYFYDPVESVYLCPKCYRLLNHKQCPKCHHKYENKAYKIDISLEHDTRDITFINFYAFDFSLGIEFLYHFKIHFEYENRKGTPIIEIANVYGITEKGLYDHKTEDYYTYDTIYKTLINNKENALPFINENHTSVAYLYLDNLDKLKYIDKYKYSMLWKLKEKKALNTKIDLYSLTVYPLYFKQYEYLMKMNLYNLACNCPYKFKQNTFENNFGIEKKYLPVMQDINITEKELGLLKLCPTIDKSLIYFYSEHEEVNKYLSNFVKLDKLKQYFISQRLSKYYLPDYSFYLKKCLDLDYDIKDKNILFPKNFLQSYEKIKLELKLKNNKDINKKIKSIATISSINNYEDNKYIIFPADSIESLFDESKQQSNCISGYYNLLSENECQIYFMRYKDNKDKSLVTIEVKEGRIVEARTKYNNLPNDEENKILSNWEKTLIPIYNQ